jgi:hypothetical protein
VFEGALHGLVPGQTAHCQFVARWQSDRLGWVHHQQRACTNNAHHLGIYFIYSNELIEYLRFVEYKKIPRQNNFNSFSFNINSIYKVCAVIKYVNINGYWPIAIANFGRRYINLNSKCPLKSGIIFIFKIYL